MQQREKRSFFTLLEIMVCLCILGTASWFSMGTMKSMLAIHKYQSSMSLVIDRVRFLQTLALVYKTDIEVRVFSDGSGVYYEIFCEEPDLLSSCKSYFLPEVESVRVDGGFIEKTSFNFTPEGFVFPGIRIEFLPKSSYINKPVFLDFNQTRML